MSLAIRNAALHWRPDAWRLARIHGVHVERNVKSRGAIAGHANRFLKDRSHAALIDVAHGKSMNPGMLHNVALLAIHGPDPHHRDIVRLLLGRVSENIGQSHRPMANATSERHSMDVPTRAAVRG